MRTRTDVPRDGAAPRPPEPPLRARGIGTVAGLAAISCCVYPLVLFLVGAASAAEAIALGKKLYGQWGWAFKLGGAGLAVAGVVVQLRRRDRCTIRGARSSWPFLARVVLVTVGVYCAVYAATKALAAWGS
jgi:hypothetical protein